MGYLLGYDIGSSSIKASLLEIETGRVLASVSSPGGSELEIIACRPGWAEQHPQIWWENVICATGKLKSATDFDVGGVAGIGISYQMHGLVVVDKAKEVLRRSIIWCDSRAVETGQRAVEKLGEEKCLQCLLNLPGNFTASKLKWVMENEPDIYSKIYKMMLPGDFIAMKMTGEIKTTPSGLSEGIMWDYQQNGLAAMVLDCYGISADLISDVVETFSIQGQLTKEAAGQLGLKAGTVVSYRAGDQPNNALSLNVLNPGEIATTAGTSGVVYGISKTPDYDEKSRINSFVHVNYAPDKPRYGVLMCLNGTGSLNRWLRENVADGLSYQEMNDLAGKIDVGSDGVVILPYGNGAERTLDNKDIGAIIEGLNFNIHNKAHLLRAGQEGIVFALNYGLEIMRGMGIKVQVVRAGHANMFLSDVFCEAFATVTGSVVQLYDTDGSAGAARGAGIGAGVYKNMEEAFAGLKPIKTVEPNKKQKQAYTDAYQKWKDVLNRKLKD